MPTKAERASLRKTVNDVRKAKHMMTVEQEEECALNIRRLKKQFDGWQFDMPHWMHDNEDCMGQKHPDYWRCFASPINGPSRFTIIGAAPMDAGPMGALNDMLVKLVHKYQAWKEEM